MNLRPIFNDKKEVGCINPNQILGIVPLTPDRTCIIYGNRTHIIIDAPYIIVKKQLEF